MVNRRNPSRKIDVRKAQIQNRNRNLRYRKLDKNGDRVFGGGLRAFYVDVPEAVALAVSTRLSLRTGEWFLDTSDGTPWYSQVLGKYTGSTRDPIVQARVLGTPGVNGLVSYASQVSSATRGYTVQVEISTVYGQAKITTINPETPAAALMVVTDSSGSPVVVDAAGGTLWTA